METQKLMEHSKCSGRGLVIGRLKEKESRNERRKEQKNYYSLLQKENLNDRSRNKCVLSDSDRIDKKDKPSLMTVISDLFGVKSNSNSSSNNVKSKSQSTTVIFVLCILLTLCVNLDASPVNSRRHSALFSLSPSARNIRHLPCVSRRTKEEGICMFAIDCLKANGTHLGTCIDRFYFGSCCQIPEEVPQIVDNHIDDNTIFGQTYHKPSIKPIQEDKLDNALYPLSSSSSSTAHATSHKTVITTQSSYQTPKPTKASPTRQPTTTPTPQKAQTTTTVKLTSHKPTFSSNRPPAYSTQKYGSTSAQKLNTTIKYETTTKKIEVTQQTRKPHPTTLSAASKRPITNGIIVNNTIYTEKLPIVNNTKLILNTTKENETIKRPVQLSTLKPINNTTVQSIGTVTTVSFSTSTTPKPFFLPSRFTTTQKPKNDSQSVETPTAPVKLSTTQYIQLTKKTTTALPETTTQSAKFTTFYSVQEETKKPTVTTKKPIITGKPIPSSSLGPHLPFGTRLPSGSSSSHKPSTSYKPTTILTTQTRPASTSSDTIPPIILTPTRPTHRPVQKPTVSQTQQTPLSKPANQTILTERPIVQRPQNSTLSNRRPIVKPTTPVVKPISEIQNATSVEPTKRPTTVIYRPSVETRPSLKPTFVSQKPSEPESQKPTTSITFRPSTIYNRRTTTTESPAQDTITTTSKPFETYRPSSSWAPTRKPPIQTTTPSSVKDKTSASPETTTSSLSSSSLSTSRTPISSTTSSTASIVTKKPLVKPLSTLIPVKLSTVTKKPVISSKPTINHIDGDVSQKPTTFGQKPLITTTTEKLGLVTWTNYLEPEITSSSSSKPYTTVQEDQWSPATPSEWVILQTVSPPNVSVTIAQPSSTTSSTVKPVHTRPTPTKRPIITTTAGSSFAAEETTTRRIRPTIEIKNQTTLEFTTKPSVIYSTSEKTTKEPIITTQSTKKPIFEFTTRVPIESSTSFDYDTRPIITIHVTTKPLQKPSIVNVTELPPIEFSTFMSVSGGPTTKPSVTAADKNITSTQFDAEITTESLSTTAESSANGTTSESETTTGSASTDSEGSTTSSNNTTVSPGLSSTPAGITSDTFNMSDFKEVCGRRLWPEARVVGGAKANFGRWPWQVSLRQWRTSTYLHKCGAALLSENWAITAAHCVDNVAPSDLLLRLGEHDLASEDEPYGYQERRVQIVASHPQFDPRTFEYDLALLRFYEPVTFQPNILPVCVPTHDEGFVGKTGFVTGWGRLYEDGPLPSVLQEVRVPVLENEDCEQMYRAAGYIEHIPHIFICAGWKNGGFDSCEGDSGGPLVLQRDDNRFQLAGIISWGIGCAEPNQPGVYTRISEFRDWINQILQF